MRSQADTGSPAGIAEASASTLSVAERTGIPSRTTTSFHGNYRDTTTTMSKREAEHDTIEDR